jgi:hypothetical protein
MRDSISFFWRGRRGDIIIIFSLVPNVFPSCSREVLKLFPTTFAIASEIYPIWFAQSSTLMYIN